MSQTQSYNCSLSLTVALQTRKRVSVLTDEISGELFIMVLTRLIGMSGLVRRAVAALEPEVPLLKRLSLLVVATLLPLVMLLFTLFVDALVWDIV
jgi:hypothetical protein